MTSRIIVNNIQSDTGVSTVTIASPVALSGGITGGGFAVGTGASIGSPATNVLTVSTNNVERIRVGAAGSIGIGTDNPTKLIDMSGVHSGINTTGRFVMSPHSAGWDLGVTSGNIAPHYQTNFTLYNGQIGSGTLRWQIDSSGRVTKPNQPAFSVYPAAGSPIGSGTLVFTGVRFNIGSHYSTSTGRFTAPIAGIYLMVLTAQHYGLTATNGWIDIRLNDAEINARYETFDGAQYTAGGISAIVQMNAGDYITIVTSGNIFHDDNTNLSGYLLG